MRIEHPHEHEGLSNGHWELAQCMGTGHDCVTLHYVYYLCYLCYFVFCTVITEYSVYYLCYFVFCIVITE